MLTLDVGAWLEGLGLGKYAAAFADNDVDGSVLPMLSDADLSSLGVASLGHRKKILAAIAALRGPGTERREVTVLLCDLSGFTALTHAMDAEDVHQMVTRYLSEVDRVCIGHGGAIDKHIGDAVMALFGAPVAHGDDALRAVRAALAIHEAMGPLSVEVGRSLQSHVGIATGSVVAGEIARLDVVDYTVHGDAPNLAARLDALAGPGQTVLDEATLRACRGLIDADDLGQVSVKGIAEPVHAFRLRSLRAAPEHTPFVGRRRELSAIRAALAPGSILALRGEAGLGKTRLLSRVCEEAAATFAVHRTAFLDFGVRRGASALAQLARSLRAAALVSFATPEEAPGDGAVEHTGLGEAPAAALADLLDEPLPAPLRTLWDALDHSARQRNTERVLAHLVRAASAERPLLLALEDVHWAPDVEIQRLRPALDEGRVAVLMTTRGPVPDRWPVLGIEVVPFDTADSLELLRAAGAAEDRAAFVADRAGGNPLFLEQLLRASDECSEVPSTVRSVLLARLDRLGRRDRSALLAASVLGQRLVVEDLRWLTEDLDYEPTALLGSGLLRAEGDELVFDHALLRDAAYGALLRRARAELHARAAERLGQRDPVLRARHLELAESPDAAQAQADAARHEIEAHHLDAALALADRGLALAPPEAPLRAALLCVRGEALLGLGESLEALAAFRAAAEVATDDGTALQANIGIGAAGRVAELADEALAALERAEVLARASGAGVDLARILHLRGNILLFGPDVDASEAAYRQALEVARRVGAEHLEPWALGGLADIATVRCELMRGLDLFDQAIELARVRGLAPAEIAHRSVLSDGLFFLGRIRESRAEITASIEGARRLGLQRQLLVGLAISAGQLVELDPARALGESDEAVSMTRRLSSNNFQAKSRGQRSFALWLLGRLQEAEEEARAALEVARRGTIVHILPVVLAALARSTRDDAERKAVVEEALAVLTRSSVNIGQLAVRILAEVAIDLGDAALLQRIYAPTAREKESGPTTYLGLVRRRALALLARARGEPSTEELRRVDADLEAAGLPVLRQRIAEALR